MKPLNSLDLRLQSLTPEILSYIAQIDELRGKWVVGVQLHPQTLKNLKQSVLVTSTGASTRIEGAKLSDEDVEKLLSRYAGNTLSSGGDPARGADVEQGNVARSALGERPDIID